MTKNLAAIVAVLLAAGSGQAEEVAYVYVLGIAQDASYPQAGCYQPHCMPGWEDKSLRRTVSSIAVIDPANNAKYLFDATPDIPDQLYRLHVEAPDESSHQADWETKVASIEAIDRHVVGPVVEKLRSFGDVEAEADAAGWRVLVAPDHYTLVDTRMHDPTPPPFLMAGAWIRSVVTAPFSEAASNDSDLHIDPGADLMEYFLYSGLKRPIDRQRH